MPSVAKIMEQLRRRPASLRFDDLAKVCEHHFGPPRQSGSSHHVYRMPWEGDPRVNIQRNKDGTAKRYQVAQVLAAVERLAKEEDR